VTALVPVGPNDRDGFASRAQRKVGSREGLLVR
jgi:hypothetical protein